MNAPTIPDHYKRITTGTIQANDRIWSPAKDEWLVCTVTVGHDISPDDLVIRLSPDIPEGYVRLEEGIVEEGDLYWSVSYDKWRPCAKSVGRDIHQVTHDAQQFGIIRKGTGQPQAIPTPITARPSHYGQW